MSAAEKLPPGVDLALENRYLGSVMVDGHTLERHPVWPRELWGRTQRTILEAALALHQRGESTDHVAVGLELERAGKLAAVGGQAFLGQVASVVELHPGPLAQRIRELAVTRKVREQLGFAVACLEDGDLAEGLRLAREAAENKHPGEETEDRYGTFAEAIKRAAAEVADRVDRKTPALVSTGIRAIDDEIVGVEYGDLTVIGGDTSAGKSSLAMFMAWAMAGAGHRPGIISCEDGENRVGRRGLAMLSGLPASRLRAAKGLAKWELEQIHGATLEADGRRIEFAYCIGEPLARVIEATRVLLREKRCDVIFLDYVQAVRVPGFDERIAMREVLSDFKRECARVVPAASAFVLSQYKRREKIHERPKRSDLYESGYLEQKADSIILLWRDEKGLMQGVLDKAKDDATEVEFTFTRERGRLKEYGLAQPKLPLGGRRAREENDDASF